MSLSTLTSFSAVTNFAPISPDYMNSKLSELQVAITQINTDAGSLSSSAKHYVDVHDYGAIGDGTTSDHTAFIRAEAARRNWQTLRGRSGYTYAISQVSTSLWTVNHPGLLDFAGATILYGGSGATLTTGSDGGSLGVVNVLVDNVGFRGTVHNNNLARYAFALHPKKQGFNIMGSVLSTATISGVWTGIQPGASVDVTGEAIPAGTRHRNVWGFLSRPDCPTINTSNSISSTTDVSAVLLGNARVGGNSTGDALVMGTASQTIAVVHTHIAGVPETISAGTANTRHGDILVHDLGANVIELYGTAAANSSAFSTPSNRTLALCVKQAAMAGWSWGNTGTDDSGYNVMIQGGSAQSTGLLEVFGNAFVSSGTLSLNSSGRLSMVTRANTSGMGNNEVAIVMQASGVSLIYRSGATAYDLTSGASAAA